jgi:hypothetical protein
MSQLLIDHSPDLKRLRDEGCEIEVKGGYLLIHQIPFVDSSKNICRGILVSNLNLVSDIQTAQPQTHVCYFIGAHPCNKDGTIISGIMNASQNQLLGDGILINHTFSNKYTGVNDKDYYDKIIRYVSIISAPAISLDKSVSSKTFKVIPDEVLDSVFQYMDTNSSRANINQLNEKFSGHKVAIIGLGGTGSYILDLVTKTKVCEIHLFDGDNFYQHNAFRSPGASSYELLELKMKKVDYLKLGYSNMHGHIITHDYFIHEDNLSELDNLDFIFISVDKDSVRKLIIDHLLSKEIQFIDVGLGVIKVDDSLIGSVRVTTCTKEKKDHLKNRIPQGGEDNNEYSSNIQIADLNCLNAVLAVIKWKKILGFYQDLKKEHHSTYSINVGHINNEDPAA